MAWYEKTDELHVALDALPGSARLVCVVDRWPITLMIESILGMTVRQFG